MYWRMGGEMFEGKLECGITSEKFSVIKKSFQSAVQTKKILKFALQNKIT